MPDPDKLWTSAEFSLACAVLEDLKQRQFNALPKEGSKKSGVVFKKFVNEDHFDLLNDDAIPGFQKFQQLRNMMNVCNNLIRIYSTDLRNLQYYHKEIASIYAYGLTVTELMIELELQFDSAEIGSTSHNLIESPSRSAYLAGLNHLLRTLVETDHFSEEDEKFLSKKICHSIERNSGWFNETNKDEIKKTLLATIDHSKSSIARSRYKKLLESF